jgi:hypothetical protein
MPHDLHDMLSLAVSWPDPAGFPVGIVALFYKLTYLKEIT